MQKNKLATGLPLTNCSQIIGTYGKRIINLFDYGKREKAYLQLSFYNINLFKKKTKPESLIDSVEWAHITFPILNLTHSPDCLNFNATESEKKSITFCFGSEAKMKEFLKAIKIFQFCRTGLTIEEANKKSNNCEGKDKNKEVDINNLDSLTNDVPKKKCPNCPEPLKFNPNNF